MRNAQVQIENRSAINPAVWVDDYGDNLYRFALSRLRDAEAAEEVVQQTFLAGLEHIKQYSGQGSEQGWLLGILKRKIIDFIRVRNRTNQFSDEEVGDPLDRMFDSKGHWRRNVHSTLLQPLQSIEREEFWPILRRCLQDLPNRQADAFTLREIDEFRTKEICKQLSISPSNLWVLLHRARLRLANCMKTRWHLEQS
ncbi:RNA polymerase sigma-24 related protein [Rhodopirellula maiorica SM1]|uniref:RNA polymerase sigma-24 related protein n=1 Tax=Rhodopirellula maiorica SM1 TaxID=1265738 RepID=M5S980_9BACT|nr:sigma-70 family RNA polymerase sigma factor [Rhodopirellula maiorica]EMI22724.1 RNA polymerase sigma-24 related protein [Rhodopirellula maiorica SM1]